MIEFRTVSKRFGAKVVLDQLELTIKKGEIFFIIGKSGTGKSVLLKHIVGLLQPDAGEVWVKGRCVSFLKEAEYTSIRKLCGLVFQQPALLDSLTVYDNIAFGLRAHRICEKETDIRPRVEEKLRLVNVPLSNLSRFPPELSYGLQKRVSLARTLVIEPEYLLFDEPTTAQDPVATAAINQLIQKLAQKLGVTCVVVSHDMHCALEIADRIALLSEGKLVDQGPPEAMIRSEKPLTMAFMREAKERSLVDDKPRDH